MELTPLRYLLVIAREGHMTRAAERLGVTQPALSAMLKKLEGEVGVELLHRTGRGVEPTEAGRVLLERARQALVVLDGGLEEVRELAGLERGRIRVGGGATAMTYLLPGVVSAFRGEHPGLRFYVREAGSAEVAEAVLGGMLDLGVVTEPVRVPGGANLLHEEWIEDEFRLIVPSGDALAGRRSFAWGDLEGRAMVAFEAGSAVRVLIDDRLAAHGVRAEAVMELRSIESIKRMVSAGVGVALVSRFALGEGEGLRAASEALTRRLALVRRSDRVPSHAVGAFAEALRAFARGVGGVGGRRGRR
ncbi:MAG: LysR family transcriptional regulator [Phycisphaerales bacterium]